MNLGLGLGINKGGFLETAPPYFAMTIDSTKAGTPSDQFQFTGALGQYNVDAVQNNVIVQSYIGLVDQQTITLPSAGIYQVRVHPTGSNPFNRIKFNFNLSGLDKDKVLSIDSFGTNVFWSSFERSFGGCDNLVEIKQPIYNGQNVTNLANGFRCKLSTLPRNIFDNCKNAISFDRTFFDNILIDLPEGVFNKNKLVTDFSQVFDKNTLSTVSLSRLYIELSITNTQNNVPFHGGNGFYDPNFSFTVKGVTKTTGQARQDLINRGWSLTDGGSI